jgi:hypothetical protein
MSSVPLEAGDVSGSDTFDNLIHPVSRSVFFRDFWQRM